MKKLNWNSTIKVNLNEHGRDIFYQRVGPNRQLRVDRHGFSSFQVWDFMHIFGPYIGWMSQPITHELCFYVDESDLDVK